MGADGAGAGADSEGAGAGSDGAGAGSDGAGAGSDGAGAGVVSDGVGAADADGSGVALGLGFPLSGGGAAIAGVLTAAAAMIAKAAIAAIAPVARGWRDDMTTPFGCGIRRRARFPIEPARLALTLDPRGSAVNGGLRSGGARDRPDTYAGPVPSVLNVSAYLFTRIDDPTALRPVLRERATAAGLKGTILLAEEGINLFLAGAADPLRRFIGELRRDPRFSALTTKESWSDAQPFGRMLVKVKREIIRMDHPTIRPDTGRAPAVAPETLRRWLDAGRDDEGREVVLLDTRNAFEVDYGSFDGALDWRIERFTQFPAAATAHRGDVQGKTVVSYCTGGIRCEKAALHLREEGIDAFQLEGGILGYFAAVGAEHWTGECFVFDEREALTPGLEPRKALA